MKMIIEVPDGIVGESLQTAHNLEMNFENYVSQALGEANERWEEREKEAFVEGTHEDVRGFAKNITRGDVITEADKKPVYPVVDVFTENGKAITIAVKDEKGKMIVIPHEDFPKYEILPF